jgi:glucose-1-phosphate thymidylyltransferase
MPVYDKPMIYYPLSTLMLAGIREILIISTPEDLPLFKKLLGNGKKLGCDFKYAQQAQPNGLAEAFIIGKEFIGKDKVALILGDNIFYGSGLKALSIEEKPSQTQSNYAVPGIYFYDNTVVDIAANIAPSHRGELEITDVNNVYLKQGKLNVSILDKGTAWLDTGTFASLMQASQFVEVIEERQGLKIGAIEEAAYEMGYITKNQLHDLAAPLLKSGYGKHLMQLD